MRALSLCFVFFDGLVPGEAPARVEAVVRAAWQPLVEALTANPGLRAAVAPSTVALHWAQREAPELLRQLGALASRGQVELLASPTGGAALGLLPEREAILAILGGVSALQAVAEVPVRGLWAGGLSYCAQMPALLARAGLLYTLVDAGLLGAAGIAEEALGAWYLTDRAGQTAGIFPLDRRLPAWVPQGSLQDFGAALHQRAGLGTRVVSLAVDVAGLGALPGSAAHCWTGEKPWMPRLLRMMARNAGWLKTAVPFLVFDRIPAAGRIWPVPATHPSFGASALDAASAEALLLAHGLDLASPRASRWQPPVVGPPAEMVLARRDEANRLHKAWLRQAAALQKARKEARQPREALDAAALALSGALPEVLLGPLLHRAELRQAAWRALVDVERAVFPAEKVLTHELIDADCDGSPELLLRNPSMSAVIRPATGGALSEWCLPGIGNLINTFTRREEPWFDAVAEAVDDLPEIEVGWTEDLPPPPPPLLGEEDSEPWSVPPNKTVSPPDQPGHFAAEPGLERLLGADHHRRVALHDRFLGPEATPQNMARGQAPEAGDFVDQPYRVDRVDTLEEGDLRVVLAREGAVQLGEREGLVQLVKTFLIHRSEPLMQVSWELSNRSADPLRSRFAVEVNLNLDGASHPERSLFVAGPGALPLGLAGEVERCSDVALIYGDLGLQIRLRASGEPALWHHPLASPAPSPVGLVASPQGTSLLFVWDTHLWGNEKKTFHLAIRAVRR